MLTNQLITYYNHLLAASLMYLAMVDGPLVDIANTLSGRMEKDYQRLSNLALAYTTGQEQDYYETLGVSKSASKQEINRAFRELAKKYHPDKNKEKNASDEFIKIFKAYETLLDDKKRKEYDIQHGPNSWSTTSDMNDFDINEFFRQYEDQFLKHAQYHQQAGGHYDHHHQQYKQQHHDKFNFHGINLDDLFHDIDDDEFNSLGRWFEASNHLHSQAMGGHFGDGASFFGTHFPSQMHDTLHQYQHQRNVHGGQQYQGGGGYACHTVTKQINGMIMTQTSCS